MNLRAWIGIPYRALSFRIRFDPLAHILSIAAVLLATLLGLLLWGIASEISVAMVYLTTIFGVATFFGFMPAVVASFAAVLAYDYFFTEPYFSLEVTSSKDIIALCLFLA